MAKKAFRGDFWATADDYPEAFRAQAIWGTNIAYDAPPIAIQWPPLYEKWLVRQEAAKKAAIEAEERRAALPRPAYIPDYVI